MTACVNRKHTKKVAAVVTASLVGALSLGVAPVVAMADDAGIEMQFTDAATAFSQGTANYTLRHGLTDVQTGLVSTTTAKTEFQKNVPVAIDVTSVTLGSGDSTPVDVTVDGKDFEVAYFNRDEKGNPTGDELDPEITEVGNYVCVVTAVDGKYEGGAVKIPFDVTAIDISGVQMSGETRTVYDATVKDIDFTLNGVGLVEGIDYTVKYVETGDDTSTAVEVKDEGTYAAVVTGMGNYAGSVTLEKLIQVHQLDLNHVYVEDIYTSGKNEPKAPDAIWINNTRYTADSPIMKEIKAELTTPTDVYFNNGNYSYTAWPTNQDASDPNIVGFKQFTVHKFAKDVTWTYDGAAWPTTWETIKTDADTKWNTSNVKATASDGTNVPVTKYMVFDDNGKQVDSGADAYDWSNTAGTYTIVYIADDGANGYGGKTAVTLTVFEENINSDAQVYVGFRGDIVTSIDTVYDGNDITAGITVTVKDSDGNPVTDYDVAYYNADGIKVNEIVDAGTYTMKVTSKDYKLSGTTEMAITVSPKDLSEVKAGAVTSVSWDNVGNKTEYLPWQPNGVNIAELDLQYFDNENDMWGDLDEQTAVLVTILDSEGNEVKKITDEGVYTIHFEARNDDAANNYVIPADLTVTCIKDGTVADKDGNVINHLQFSDVAYTDYFANAVSFVANNHFMTGYKGTKLFGSYDKLTRGQMAIVLYNMAKGEGKVDENDLTYTNAGGWMTGFDDVNGNEYYAKAIAWAKLAGVVNGYDETHFGPNDQVTREQFAAMPMNYTKKFGDYKQADASVLDNFDDASGVSSWAKNSVAWGVENGILGNGGFLSAQSNIIRADAACMVYNYAK